jgi:hypothetical protein
VWPHSHLSVKTYWPKWSDSLMTVSCFRGGIMAPRIVARQAAPVYSVTATQRTLYADNSPIPSVMWTSCGLVARFMRYRMAKKRQPIEALIDALVWMRHCAKQKSRESPLSTSPETVRMPVCRSNAASKPRQK